MKKNQTEFIQLIHALIDLERIQPKANQGKWELIEEIASFFGISLSALKENNLSKSKNNRKQVPKLFHELHEIYLQNYKLNPRKS